MTTALITHLDCLDHDMGRGHPECPARLRAVLAALEHEMFAPLLREQAPLATVEQIARVHPETYVKAILAIRPEPGDRLQLDGDTSMSAGSADAALRAAGGAVLAVDLVVSKAVRTAFAAVRPPGHHAEPSRPMGFCLFNNAAIAAAIENAASHAGEVARGVGSMHRRDEKGMGKREVTRTGRGMCCGGTTARRGATRA